jgi:hypothetical protein
MEALPPELPEGCVRLLSFFEVAEEEAYLRWMPLVSEAALGAILWTAIFLMGRMY